MSEENTPKHEDMEIIEEHVVPTLKSQLIKIKVKERFVTRKSKKKLSIGTKLLILISVVILGFIVGTKIVSRYISYWRNPQIEYPTEIESPGPKLEAGQVYSLDKE